MPLVMMKKTIVSKLLTTFKISSPSLTMESLPTKLRNLKESLLSLTKRMIQAPFARRKYLFKRKPSPQMMRNLFLLQ
jgi:hypothetical protein